MRSSQGSARATGAELNGFIVIDKPKGPTSHQVDYWIRTITGTERVGHVGTLDPQVTGVLVVALGDATKLIEVAHEQSKEYVCVMLLHRDVPTERLQQVFQEFTGDIYQLPPVKSAVSRSIRVRRIHSLSLVERDGRYVMFRVVCESGTYIRTLCVDMGYALGTGAQMVELRRVRTGPFTEKEAVTLQQVSDAFALLKAGDARLVKSVVKPMVSLFSDVPKVVVKKSAVENIAHGSDLYAGGIKHIIGHPGPGDRVCVITDDNQVVGTGKMLVPHDSMDSLKVVDFDRVLVKPREPAGRKKPDVRKERKVVRGQARRGH